MLWAETDVLQGPLAKVWLAAHERKLTKAQLLQTSITRSTQAIVEQDEAPLALRLSGQLLLGVVRIYSRKARYLLDDCNEALMKIKLVHIPSLIVNLMLGLPTWECGFACSASHFSCDVDST